MSCERYENYIADYLEGELEPARHEELMKHIETCDACRDELRAFMQQDQELERYFARDRERLAAMASPVAGEGHPARVVPARHPWRRAAWAAAAVIFIGLAGVMFHTLRLTVATGHAVLAKLSVADGDVLLMRDGQYVAVKSGDEVRQNERLKVGAGGYAALALAGEENVLEIKGGTQVTLADFPNRFEVQMNRGQVWAHLPTPPAKPFTVRTAQLTATAKGTIYGVEEELDRTIVRVADGVVDVQEGGEQENVVEGETYNSLDGAGDVTATNAISWSRFQEALAILFPQGNGTTDAEPALTTTAAPAPGPTPAPADSAEPAAVANLAGYLPTGTRVFATIADLPKVLAEFNASDYKRLFEEPSLRRWWESVRATEVLQSLQKEMRLAELFDIVRLITGEIVFGVTGDDFVLLAESEPNVAGVLERLDAMIVGDPNITDKAKARAELRNHLQEVNGVVVVSSRATLLMETVHRISAGAPTGFIETPFYLKADAEAETAPFVAAVDLATLLAPQTLGVPENEMATYDFLGLGTLDHALIAPHFKGRGMLQAARLGFKHERAGVMDWLAEPRPMRGLDFFSAEVRLFSAAVLKNPSVAYYDMMMNYKDAPADTPPAMLLKFLGEHKPLLDALGGEVAIGIENPLIPVPNVKVVVELRDPVAFAPRFDGLIKQVELAGRMTGKEMALEHAEYKGYLVHTLSCVGAPVDLSWAYVDEFLVLGPGARFVQHSIDTYDLGHSIADDSRLLDLLPQERDATFSLLVYQNLAAVVNQFMQAKLIPALGSESAQFLPDLSYLEKYSAPGIAYAYADNRAIDFYLNAPSGIDLNMGMAVPVVADWLARRTSVGQSVTKLMQAEEGLSALAGAAVAYREASGSWPATLDALVGSPGYIERIPEDPFATIAGESLKMIAGPGADQITLYSIGPDGVDDKAAIAHDPGVALDAKGDVVLTLPIEETPAPTSGGEAGAGA